MDIDGQLCRLQGTGRTEHSPKRLLQMRDGFSIRALGHGPQPRLAEIRDPFLPHLPAQGMMGSHSACSVIRSIESRSMASAMRAWQHSSATLPSTNRGRPRHENWNHRCRGDRQCGRESLKSSVGGNREASRQLPQDAQSSASRPKRRKRVAMEACNVENWRDPNSRRDIHVSVPVRRIRAIIRRLTSPRLSTPQVANRMDRPALALGSSTSPLGRSRNAWRQFISVQHLYDGAPLDLESLEHLPQHCENLFDLGCRIALRRK